MGGKVGKAILGAALIGASFLVPGLGLGIFAGLATQVLVATGTGLLLQAFYGKSLESSQQSIEINSANPLAPLPVLYGKTRVGLRLVDMQVKGKDLYIVGALCHGSEDGSGIQAIDEIYFNDKLAFDAAGTAIEGVAKRTENAPPPIGAQVVALCTVTKYLGTDTQVADATMIANFPNTWNSDSRGRGVAYVVVKLQWHEKLFPTGIPNIVCVVRGNKVYDPRSATTAHSTNPILHARDYLRSNRYGAGAAASEIDDAAIQAMANHCDELVTVPSKYDGPSFRKIIAATMAAPCEVTLDSNHGLLTGARVSIGLNGGTGITGLVGEWTITVTAPNKATLNGSSTTGPGYVPNSCAWVAFVQQKRFEGNGWLDTSREPKDNLADLLSACRGNMVYANGVYSPFIRRIASPVTVVAISEDNILGEFSFNDQGIKDAPNLARAKFINEKKQYSPDEIQWPRAGITNTYLTEDNGFESSTDMNLPFTTDRIIAQQIAMVTLRETRGAIVAEMVVNEQGLLLQVGDVVPVTHSTPGWVAKPFWVMGMAIVGAHSVRLVLLEYTSGAYSLDEQQVTLSTPDTNLPNPVLSGPPTAVAASNSSVIGSDGTVVNTITLGWTAPTSDANPILDHYQIRYKLDFETLWRPAPDPKLTDTQAIFPGVGVGNWLIHIRAVNSLGTTSDWIEATVTVAGGTGTGGSTPATVAGLTAQIVSGNIEVKYNANTEADIAGYEIREGGATWAASTFLDKTDSTSWKMLKQRITKRSYTIRVKPFTRSGTYSVADATVAISQPIPDPTAVAPGDITVVSKLGKMRVEVDLTGTGATQARLYCNISSGFGPVTADRQAERIGLINSDKAIFEFTLPTLFLGATIYCKIGLKDELSDQLGEAEQFTSQFTITGRRIIFSDTTRVDGGTGLDVIAGLLTDAGELAKGQRIDGQIRTVVQLMDPVVPNPGFDIWDSPTAAHAWELQALAGASVAKETSIVRRGDASLKYVMPASSTFNGIVAKDPTKSYDCVSLRPGRTYSIKISAQSSRVAEGQKYRLVLYYDPTGISQDIKVFNFKTVNTWQDDEWVVKVPATASANSRLFIQFDQNGYAGGAVNCYVDGLEVDEIEVQTYYDNGDQTGNFTIDCSNGSRQRVRITTNTRKLITLSNPTQGAIFTLAVERGPGGGAYDFATTNISWPNGRKPGFTVNDDHQDVFTLLYDGVDNYWRVLSFSGDHSDLDVQVRMGQFQTPTGGGGTAVISGLGFTPKGIMFFSVGNVNDVDVPGVENGNMLLSVGFASGTGARVAVATNYINGLATSDCSTIKRGDAVLIRKDTGAGTTNGLLDLQSLDADGFTVVADEAFSSNGMVFWIAFGGNSVSAKAGQASISSGTGNKAITGVGFAPTFVMIAAINGQTDASSGVQSFNDLRLSLGMAAKNPYYGGGVTCGLIEGYGLDNSGTDDTKQAFDPGRILATHTTAGVATNASLSSLDSDGFTLNYANNANAHVINYFCLGGVKAAMWLGSSFPSTIYHYPLPGDFTFRPLGIITLYNRSTLTSGALNDHLHMGIGAACANQVGANRTAAWPGPGQPVILKQAAVSVFSNDSPASGNSECRRAWSQDHVVYQLDTNSTATIAEAMDVRDWGMQDADAYQSVRKGTWNLLHAAFGA